MTARLESINDIPGHDLETELLVHLHGERNRAVQVAYAIDTLNKDLKDGRCVPHAVETYDDLRTFVHGERGAMAAIKGSHDDRVMALSLANIGAQQNFTGELMFA